MLVTTLRAAGRSLPAPGTYGNIRPPTGWPGRPRVAPGRDPANTAGPTEPRPRPRAWRLRVYVRSPGSGAVLVGHGQIGPEGYFWLPFPNGSASGTWEIMGKLWEVNRVGGCCECPSTAGCPV